MVVTVIGYRATGKSTVARQVAGRLGWPWYDSDDEIEQRTGSTIANLFATTGEKSFREYEEEVIGELTHYPLAVLSVGGGAVLSARSRERIGVAGPVVWLRARPATILIRLKLDQDQQERRPALTSLAADEEVRVKLLERTPLYAALADLVVDTDELSPSDIAHHIQLWVEQRLADGQVET